VRFRRAVRAAVEVAVRLDTVADHLHAAVPAHSKLSKVCASPPGHGHLERPGVPYTSYKRADAHGCCREIDAQESL
jgi:hypothetical protein